MLSQLTPSFNTALGSAYLGESLELLKIVPSNSKNLIISSPPFALYSKEIYGSRYVTWMLKYAEEFERILLPTGSLVLELGSTWFRDIPERSVHNYQLISKLCSQESWHLIQEFYWYNQNLLTTPNDWTEREYIRFNDSISIIWWLSRTTHPQVNTSHVSQYRNSLTGKLSNLLLFDDVAEDAAYLSRCYKAGLEPQSDRFPSTFPDFFIRLLTKPNDTVLDPFAGSCTTGKVAESLGRNWICIEGKESSLNSGILRFDLV